CARVRGAIITFFDFW
nr:immunoglobulin heavy chain junction region [Macaca mulatta]MOW99553.1 immunoglobulin heavy chain junction region [Macaca mulatta]MOX00835.1 immunoglobulin heavy chain junction region [Macaca mulatta]MOX02805.1 immunoglobulin heavy chain junction region [Macaca mulatta]MOX05601.1 immunoglobulin heavy chain junction region [Macaca mulatta]